MKSWISATVLISFLAIAVFGFLAMGEGAMEGAHGRCLTETAAGQVCPVRDSFAAAVFHLSVFRSFSQVVFGNSLFGLLLALGLAAVLAFAQRQRALFILPSLNAGEKRRRFLRYAPIPFTQDLLRWLAFHENSPSRI
ncbi:MAG: hypothetical protein AAB967_00580 [Patescibacteria group bacterium]